VAEVPYVADEVPYEEPEQLPNPIDMVDDAGEYSQITFKVYETIVDEQSIRVIIEYRPEDDVVSPIGIISSTGHIRYLTEGDPFNDKVFQISADYLETLTPSLLKRLPSVIYYRDMTDNTVYFKQGNDMVKIGKWTSKELDGDGYIDTTI
jgi:hypothetical protein